MELPGSNLRSKTGLPSRFLQSNVRMVISATFHVLPNSPLIIIPYSTLTYAVDNCTYDQTPNWSLSCWFSDQNFVCTLHLPHAPTCMATSFSLLLSPYWVNSRNYEILHYVIFSRSVSSSLGPNILLSATFSNSNTNFSLKSEISELTKHR
jgi:hypothetical protein